MRISGIAKYFNYDFINFEGKIAEDGNEKTIRVVSQFVAKPDTKKIESANLIDDSYQRIDMSFRSPVKPKFAVLGVPKKNPTGPISMDKPKKSIDYFFESTSQLKKEVKISSIQHDKREIVLCDLSNPIFDWFNVVEILKLQPGDKAHTVVNQISLQKGELSHSMQKFVYLDDTVTIEKENRIVQIRFVKSENGLRVQIEDGSPVSYDFAVAR